MRDAVLALVGLAGWCLITAALAAWISALVWPISFGVLFVGLVGFRAVAHILWHGVTTFLPKE
jgi:hypothetical protein